MLDLTAKNIIDNIPKKDDLDKIIDSIKKYDTLVVSSHISPDGDNVGSTMGFIKAINKINKKVYYVLDDLIPSDLGFLCEGIKKYTSDEFRKVNEDKYILISFDSADKDRICTSQILKDEAEFIINIDHHNTNDSYGRYNYVIAEYSSSCELCFNLILYMEKVLDEKLIDDEVATPLYAGILTDTGNFKYESSAPSTLRAGAYLLERGARKQEIVTRLFQNMDINVLKILGEAINNIELIGDRVSLIVVDIEMMKKYSVSYDQIDIITDYARDIEGIEVGIFIKQKSPGEFKVSLRSKNYIDVSEVAKSLGGGGHKRASGLSLYTTKEDAIKTIVEAVKKAVY